MLFSLILPTRYRLNSVQRLFNSIIETADDPPSLEIILYVDEDDLESAKISSDVLDIIKIIRPRRKMGIMTRECFDASRGRYIGMINDDMIIRTKEWDLAVKKAFAQFPDEVALVYPNDKYYGERVSTFPFMTRRTCELLEKICPPDYASHCIDSHIFDIFKKLSDRGYKRAVYLPHVIFEHRHYSLGLEAYSKSPMAKNDSADRSLYLSFDEDRARIASKIAQTILRHERAAPAASDPGGRASIFLLESSDYLSEETSRTVRAIFDDPLNESLLFEVVIVSDKPDSKRNKSAADKRTRTFFSKNRSSGIATLNEAARDSQNPYLIFLEAGFLPKSGWLSRLMSAASSNAEAGIIGSKWLDARTLRIEHAGVSFFKDGGELKKTYIYKGFKASEAAVQRLREFQAVEKSGMLVKREAFLKVGGFTEDAPGFEALDLCFKVRELKKSVLVAPDACLLRSSEGMDSVNKENFKRLLSRWGETIYADLTQLLAEDGFFLEQKNGVYHLTQTNGSKYGKSHFSR